MEPDGPDPEIPYLNFRCNRVVALNPWVKSVWACGHNNMTKEIYKKIYNFNYK